MSVQLTKGESAEMYIKAIGELTLESRQELGSGKITGNATS